MKAKVHYIINKIFFKNRIYSINKIYFAVFSFLTKIPKVYQLIRIPFIKAHINRNHLYVKPDFLSAKPVTQDISSNNKNRSVVFLNNCYYNFYYLAAALRKRGWDAISVSLEGLESPNYQFYHGQDLILHDYDPVKCRQKLISFYHEIKNRFKMLHYYGTGSVLPEYRGLQFVPWDILELKGAGVKIGYTISGCNDLNKQSTFEKWSKGGCNQCIWKGQPDVCSDHYNMYRGWINLLSSDLICVETDPLLDYKKSNKVYPDPLTYAMDPSVWDPCMLIPEEYRISKNADEVVIYHAVGNYELRSKGGKNFKGTHIVLDVIERLRKKGHKIKFDFINNVPSTVIKYYQLQSDIVIDQLFYGRFGANARECLMLGKPTISLINQTNGLHDERPSPCILETAIVSADETNLEMILEDLIVNKEKRLEIGRRSRDYALKWWDADKCAERYEFVYDHLMMGMKPSKIVKILRESY